MANSNSRIYPQINLPETSAKPNRPLSIVVVKFSGDYEHNFLKSECVHNGLNQIITVENTKNIYFDNLSQAIIHGVEQAVNDLIIVVHEDVLFPKNWQIQFEFVLSELEKIDGEWGLLGSVGWDFTPEQTIFGHVSDPNGYVNTFKNSDLPFREIEKLDEQILIMHRSRMPKFDKQLPSIHFLGQDLPHSLDGLKSYVIDAPTIHKYADEYGHVILKRKNSPKIKDRRTLEYLADFEFSLDYFKSKWPKVVTPTEVRMDFSISKEISAAKISRPLIICSNSQAASEWLLLLLTGFGFKCVSLASEHDTEQTKRSIQKAFYHGVLAKFKGQSKRQIDNISKRINYYLVDHLIDQKVKPWVLHVRETDYLLPELRGLFKGARYIFLDQQLDFAAAENNHFGARLDNQIGRAVIPASYDYFNLSRDKILKHSENDWAVINVLFRHRLINEFKTSLDKADYLDLALDSILKNPIQVKNLIIKFINNIHVFDEEIESQSYELPDINVKQSSGEDAKVWRKLIQKHIKHT